MKTLFILLILFLPWSIPNCNSQSLSEHPWPEGFSPETSSFYVKNQIEILASPEQVWNELIQAESWPSWYYGASDVKIIGDNPTSTLRPNSKFSWKTMGLDFISEILDYQPYAQLSWLSSKKSIQGYHVWLIIPTETGCRVITAESQNGWLTTMEKLFQPKKLYRQHEDWLQLLKNRVEENSSKN